MQTDAVRLLGATLANGSIRYGLGACAASSSTFAQDTEGGNTTEAGNATANVVLWPKVFVLAISQNVDALTDKQQDSVRGGR